MYASYLRTLPDTCQQYTEDIFDTVLNAFCSWKRSLCTSYVCFLTPVTWKYVQMTWRLLEAVLETLFAAGKEQLG